MNVLAHMIELVDADHGVQSDWISEAIPEYLGTVMSLVPPKYDSYFRILHQALDAKSNKKSFVSWGVVADQVGVKVGPETHWEKLESLLVGDLENLYEAPEEGTLDETTLVCLIEILTEGSTNCDLSVGVWDGYEVIDSIKNAPSFDLCNQKYRLLKGNAANVTTSVCPDPFYQSPNMIWPDDQSWFIATAVDFRSTYIGCSRISGAALLSEFQDRAIEVLPTTKITLT